MITGPQRTKMYRRTCEPAIRLRFDCVLRTLWLIANPIFSRKTAKTERTRRMLWLIRVFPERTFLKVHFLTVNLNKSVNPCLAEPGKTLCFANSADADQLASEEAS